MTQSQPSVTSEPRYSIDRSTSVVITRHAASGRTDTSPVSRPTSWKSSCSSRNFWFESALSGEV